VRWGAGLLALPKSLSTLVSRRCNH
jgi:hypothetical protein